MCHILPRLWLFSFHRDCSKNHAPWDVLKMDHLYNLSDVLHYKDVSLFRSIVVAFLFVRGPFVKFRRSK